MADAAQPHEVRVSEVLLEAEAPMTAAEILRAVRTRYGMNALRKSDINSVLYGCSAYQAVPGSQPPSWRVEGAGAQPGAQPAAHEWDDLAGLPPLGDAPDGSFAGRPVIVGGDLGDPALAGASVAALLGGGATRFVCLVGQKGGAASYDHATEKGLECVRVPYPPPADGAPRRGVLAEAHRSAVAVRPACLCLLSPPATSDYAVHHLLICAEAAEIPVYRAG